MLDLEEKMKTLRLKIEEQSRAQITEASRQVGLKLEEDIADLRLGLNKQSTYLKDLELELAGRGSGETGSEEASAQLSALTARLKALEEAQTSLQLDLGKCCRNEAQLQTSVQEFMRQWVETSLTTNSSDEDPSARAFKAWLENHYMSKDQFQERIQILVETMREDIREEILAAVTKEAQRKARESAEEAVSKYTSDQKFQDQISSQISVVASSAAAAAAAATVSASSAASETEIVKIVQSALQKYDADKTGMFDFALESAGGTIASTRCTETHDVSNALYSVLGIPIWWEKNDPRTILQPGSSPGQCWAFKGSHGSVVVKLSSPIHVSAVSLEHISKMISRDGTIDSAPKSFSVLGLQRIDDPRPMHLGNFTYSDSDQPVQTFYLQQLTDRPALDLIELKILSNQGHNAYTCLYRFRVHGRLPDEKRTKVTASENEPTV